MNKSDSILWCECIKGKKEAFQTLYNRYYPLMFNYGLKFVSDTEFIKDCVHEVFVRLIQNHKNLPVTGFVKGYLLKACKNRIFDEIKKEKYTEDISLYENVFISNDLYVDLFEDNHTFPDQDIRKLSSAFQKLPARQREIIYLYFISGLNHQEIMSVMDINYQSSKNLLFRAIHNLRKQFDKE